MAAVFDLERQRDFFSPDNVYMKHYTAVCIDRFGVHIIHRHTWRRYLINVVCFSKGTVPALETSIVGD